MKFINDTHKEMHDTVFSAVSYNDETPDAVDALAWYDKMVSSFGDSSSANAQIVELRSEVATLCSTLMQMRKEHDAMFATMKVLSKFFNLYHDRLSDEHRRMECLYKEENGYLCLKYD